MIERSLKGLAIGLAALAAAGAAPSDEGLTRIDHHVQVKSTAPAMAGQDATIYVREVVQPSAAPRGAARGVVLFIHSFGPPGQASFDVAYGDYSWMAYLAKAGFDVFAMDMLGYGGSTRPAPMNDPCNLQKAAQVELAPSVLPAPCAATWPHPITTMGSDLDDIAAVVDRLRALRRVDKLALVGWSEGAPRAAGYAMRNPGKVSRLVLLAPGYNPAMPAEAPDPPAGDGTLSARSASDFKSRWESQRGCAGQIDPAVEAAVWLGMAASDPVGATWGTGLRRAPIAPSWGFNKAAVARMTTPLLMITGALDIQVPPERVRALYNDLGSREKMLIDLACSSHNAMWEKNHLLLFQASTAWLRDGKVGGASSGAVRIGY